MQLGPCDHRPRTLGPGSWAQVGPRSVGLGLGPWALAEDHEPRTRARGPSAAAWAKLGIWGLSTRVQ